MPGTNDPLTHTCNLVWNNSSGSYSGPSAGTGEISSDPLFGGAADYDLQSGSPAIDAGTAQSAVTSVDIAEGTRPSGSGWDMACYEFTSTGSNPRIVCWQEVAPP